jgi:hypothetical protein
MSFARWRSTGVRTAVLVGVVLTLDAAAIAVASPLKTPSANRQNVVLRGHSMKPTALPPGAVTTYPIEVGSESILVGDGGVWQFDGTTVHRVALGAEPLVGQTDASVGTLNTGPLVAGGKLWSIGRGPEQCAPYSYPYALRENDLMSGAPVQAVVLPGWCRNQEDNRDAPPQLVVGGGSAWVASANPLSSSSFDRVQVVRVDIATGDMSATALNGPVGIIAADDLGAWAFRSDGFTLREDNNLGVMVVGPLKVDRVDLSGTVLAANLLPDSTMLAGRFAADRAGLWIVCAVNQTGKSSKPQRIALAHVTRTGSVVVAKNVSAWSVASGDGQTWFLGTIGKVRQPKRGSLVPWVLGQVDPRTGAVTRSVHLDVPDASSPVTGNSFVPPLQLAAVMDGAVWIETVGAVGPTHKQQLIRVAISPRQTTP